MPNFAAPGRRGLQRGLVNNTYLAFTQPPELTCSIEFATPDLVLLSPQPTRSLVDGQNHPERATESAAMGLSQKAGSIANEFGLSDDDVRKCSKQFIFELGSPMPLVRAAFR